VIFLKRDFMKTTSPIFLVFLLLFAFNTFAQEQVAVELKEAKILYHRYPNVIFVPNDSCNSHTTDVIVLNNGTIQKGENIGEYIVWTQNTGVLDVAVLRISESVVVDTLRIVNYKVISVPYPNLYWGRHEEGMEVHLFENRIFAKKSDHIFINQEFTVLSWKFYVGDTVVSGTGLNVSAAKELFKDGVTTPTEIVIVAILKDSFSEREFRVSGTWVVMPGAANITEPYRPDPCIYRE
jgi:hypothetical protein